MDDHPPPEPSGQPDGGSQLNTVYTSAAGKAAAGAAPAQLPALTVGQYRVLRLIGQGGMGAVYEAEQQHPQRMVALKVIKAGMVTRATLRRFEQEAEALGRLQHPGIAQIYEAGTAPTETGPQPFFAMELVHGRPLTGFAEERGLNTRGRLELVAKICDAVHHAHQRGIVHRDLKPANILVDASGQPKVLDFGVARVTDSDAQATLQTDVGQVVGTLAYMSPEQVLADPLEIDTRSDVYALGVILYELLTGRLPHRMERMRIHEALQAIREEEPATLGSVDRKYRGDIETIVAKALEKDKARRYASAADLAADIRRHLTDEPIVARPATTTYQIRKFARRHRALVSGVAAVFLALVGGVVASTWQAIRAVRAEQTARLERDRATAVNDFLETDLLAQADTNTQTGGDKPDPDIKVRVLLDRAAAQVAGRFAGQPRVEASIEETIGKAYRGLGLYSESEPHLQRALDSYRRSVGPEQPETLAAAETLGELERTMGRYAQAESLLQATVEALRRTQGVRQGETLTAMT
ncbi:MAG: serine/threonine-protein kinase, partial [Bryobacteraceae bacterium]